MKNWVASKLFRRAQVYSHVYNVPVLFLRGRRACGAPLSPEQVWADMARYAPRLALPPRLTRY
jgi:hypothetical protein